MERAHDVGGRLDLGAVDHRPAEPVFAAAWERRARALVYAASMAHPNPTTSGFRDAIERMEPEHYLTSSYYEHWLTAAASIAVEAGAFSHAELEERAGGRVPLARPPLPATAVAGVTCGASRFEVGDTVQVRQAEAPGHTRCPSYVRGQRGLVVDVQGTFVLPDVEAHSPRRDTERVYTVRFRAADLWPGSEDGAHVNVGLWDSYLEAV